MWQVLDVRLDHVMCLGVKRIVPSGAGPARQPVADL